jgi:hypothetical protein
MAGMNDGVRVNAANSNAAWLAKNGDDTATGKITLSNADAVSGSSITNLQKTVNENSKVITGSRNTPQVITAVGGIAFTGMSKDQHWYIKGSTSGSTISANPQIAEASAAGQRLKLTGTSDADWVEVSDGNGLITGGQTLRLRNNSVAIFEADEDLTWVLESTNGLV